MSTLLPVVAAFLVLRTVTLMVCGLMLPRLVACHTIVAGCGVAEYRSTVCAGPPSTETLAIPRSGPIVETHVVARSAGAPPVDAL